MNELFTLLSGKVDFDKVRIGEMGYTTLNVEADLSDYTAISAHCPARLQIRIHRPVLLLGYMNGSSPWTPSAGCGFLIDDQPLGMLFGAFERTKTIRLEAGTYRLEITAINPHWKHSLFLIKEIT